MPQIVTYLKNLTVGRRIIASFAILTALLLLLATVGFVTVGDMAKEVDYALRVNAKTAEFAARARTNLGDLRLYEKDLFLNLTSPTKRIEYESKWNGERAIFLAEIDELEKHADTDIERAHLKAVRAEFGPYESTLRTIIARIESKEITDEHQASVALAPAAEHLHKLEVALDALTEDQFKIMDGVPAHIDRQAFRTRLLNVGLGFGATLTALVVSVLLTFSITKPLGETVKQAQEILQGRVQITAVEEMAQMQQAFDGVRVALQETRELKDRIEKDNKELQDNIIDLLRTVADASDGDLTVRATISAGSLGNVADAFNSLMESLQSLLGQVRTQIERTNDAVGSIQRASTTMAEGADSQAREVKSARDLVDVMSREITKVSTSAGTAADAAKRTEESANEGARAVQDVISGMGTLRANVQAGAKKMKNLGDRSMEITGIVGTISRISEQTNMLALNAAIEAARAGEHGRGFSVVADEVRKLAERTATATQEIDKLVKTIHAETNETVEAIEQQTNVVEQESLVVGKAGNSLQKIRQVSNESATIVFDISTVANKQAEGATHVVRAMEQISAIAKATQQGIQGTTATVEQLSSLSNSLRASMQKFKTA